LDILEAHGRLVLMQERAGVVPDDDATTMAPVIDSALAELSGMLGDATDDAGLVEAIGHGASLLSCGVIDGPMIQAECRDLMDQLADHAARMERGGQPCSTG
jgi:hypothetical protein